MNEAKHPKENETTLGNSYTQQAESGYVWSQITSDGQETGVSESKFGAEKLLRGIKFGRWI